jgi:hypothetical protein
VEESPRSDGSPLAGEEKTGVPPRVSPPAPNEGEAAQAGAAPVAPEGTPRTPAPLEALPAIETLTYESDFAPFLKPGVPKALRQQALRQLWRSNPVLANLDGLNDYDEDYSLVGKLSEAVSSLFRVGRGMVTNEEAAAEAEAAEAGSTPNAAAAETPAAEPLPREAAAEAAETAPTPAPEGEPEVRPEVPSRPAQKSTKDG